MDSAEDGVPCIGAVVSLRLDAMGALVPSPRRASRHEMHAGSDAHDWYQSPRYYDLVFASLTRAEAAFLDAVYEQFAPRGRRRVLEPACGSGRLLSALTRRGYSVTGFDRSKAMVQYSERRMRRSPKTGSKRPAIFVGDMIDFDAGGRFELAHCLVSTFKYLLSEEAARSHLRCVARHLVPGGVYVLGFHLTDYDETKRDTETWHGKRGNLEVHCTITSEPPERRRRRERMCSALEVFQHKSPPRRLTSRWQFRTYDARQVRSLLASVPELEHIVTFDMGYDLDSPQDLGEENLDQVLILRRTAH